MTDHTLRVVFAGTPEFAATHLQCLLDSNHYICSVFTQPDRPSGSGRKISISPVKELALANALTVYQPESLKAASARQMLHSLKADIMVVVAYGLILPVNILEIPRYGCINVHASLLPRWRGAAPIQRAIEAGDKESGVTVMQMDVGLDTGDMLLTSRLTISETETSDSLHRRLSIAGTKALIDSLTLISQQKVKLIKQDNTKASYANKLTKAEASIDWSLSASELDRKIRAFNPWPGSYISQNHQKIKIIAEPFVSKNTSVINEVMKINADNVATIISADSSGLRVSCASGSLMIKSLQLPGKKMTAVADLLNSYKDRFKPGLKFDR